MRLMPKALVVAALALAMAPTAHAQVPPPYVEAATEMLASTDQAGPSARHLRLLLAAGRFAEAEQVAERLEQDLRATQPTRAGSMVPWRIYARARGYETTGLTADAALRRAFQELYGSLTDLEMASVIPWYWADLDQMEDRTRQVEVACTGMALIACPTGEEVVSARQGLETWRYLLPLSTELIYADARRRFDVEDDLLVDTSDGARLAVMVVRPRRQGQTALLNFGIYNRADWSFPDAVQMAAHGYAGVIAYTRGKAWGTGADPVPYVHDGEDAAAVIDWIARQSWSDGRVGMFSGSYNSFTQWAAAKHRPAALRAIATNASAAPGIDVPMQGGVFQSFVYPWPIYAASGSQLDEETYSDAPRWGGMVQEWFDSGRPYRDLERIDGRANPIFRQWLNHPTYDDYWQAMIPQGQQYAEIDIPVFAQTGYFDGGQVGVLHYFREHLRYRPEADHRLLIGPYHHTAMQGGVRPVINGQPVDESARIDLAALRLSWFDHVFRGAPMPELLRDRVNFQVMGADEWRHVSTLDEMAPDRLRLFLGAGEGGVHRLAHDRPGPAVSLEVDFTDRKEPDAEFDEGTLDLTGVAQFQTDPLSGEIEVIGTFRGQLQIITNKRDLDLEVTLFELRADGEFVRLSAYLGRARYMRDRRQAQLLQPGVLQTLTFESETMTAIRLAPGSRLVALIGVPFRPDMQINYGTGGDVSDESVADAGEALRVQFLPGSWLELGVAAVRTDP